MEKLCVFIIVLGFVGSGLTFQRPSRKTGWAKRILQDNIYTAGRLTTREIKYAAESGFKGIVSTLNVQKGEGTKGEGNYLPSTQEAKDAAALAGIPYVTLTDAFTDDPDNPLPWVSVNHVVAFKEKLSAMETPLIFHCAKSYASTFVLLSYFANETQNGNTDVPKISAEDIFKVGATVGFNYYKNDPMLLTLVYDMFGVNVTNPAVPKLPEGMDNWQAKYWHAHHIYGGWFATGQILSSDLATIKATGFKTIVNVRNGSMTDGTNTQEGVNLLNIKDSPFSGGDGRQTTAELEKNRIDPNKPNTYISPTSAVNYESRNPLEFGDDIGYNETLERDAVTEHGLRYQHLPIGLEVKFPSLWDEYGEQLKIADQNGPVLVHCKTTFAAAMIAILAPAQREGKDRAWIIKRIKEVGFDVSINPEYVKLLQKMDKEEEIPCAQAPGCTNGASGVQSTLVVFLMSLIISIKMLQ